MTNKPVAESEKLKPISRTEILTAAAQIQPFLRTTPVILSQHYSSLLGVEAYLKLESLQPTHSFKVRGAFTAALTVQPDLRARGMITATGGNHGLALAFVARELDVPATIYVPQSTSQGRQELIRRLGAEVVVFGRDWDDANEKALSIAREAELMYVHPFDNRSMIAGAATIVTELIEQLDHFNLIVASIGGGGLISGLLSAVRWFSPDTRVVGVETVGADSMFQSYHAGQLIELPEITSIASSLAARRPGELTYEIVRRAISDLVTVSDKEALAAAMDLLESEKLLVEPAASCCLAALTSGQIQVKKGERLAVIVCGANNSLTDLQNLAQS